MAAANESQGLKIAVAIFVTLTVILAVTSYFLYSSYARAEGLLQAEAEKSSKAQRQASEALNQYDEFRKLVGSRAEEFDPAKTEVATHFKKVDDRLAGIANMIGAAISKAQAAGAQGPELEDAKQKVQQIVASYQREPNKNYISALDRLLELLENTALLDAEVSSNYVNLRRNLESTTSVSKQQIDVQAKAAADSRADLEAENTKHEDERQVLLSKVDQLTTDLDQTRTELANVNTQLRQMKEDDERKLELAHSIIREQRDQLDKRENVLDRPDGRVTYVDFNRGEVHVDINRRQGARPQMVMSVFDANAPGIPTEKPKGTIELIQVGDQYSIGRITNTVSPIEPMRIGDIIYSPAWSPNEPMQFALIGKIDVNRDGKDDRDDLKRMIQEAGGEVVYDLPPPEVGKESGELTPRIAWYVTDERIPLRDIYSNKSEATLTQQANFSSKTGEMIKEARSFGIRPITISRLLAYLGYEMGAPVVGRAEAVNTRALNRLTEKRSTGENQQQQQEREQPQSNAEPEGEQDDLMNAPSFP